MGQKSSTPFTPEELEDFEDCTFLSKKQILRVHERFQEYDKNKNGVLTKEEFINIPDFKYNPFIERIAEVFSQDGSGDMQFDDFLDFMSIFSSTASQDVKVSYAFRIYDFDEDGYLGVADIEKTLDLIVSHEMTPQEKQDIVDTIFGESDIDGDKKISFVEFDNVVKKAPDFVHTFFIRV